MTTWNKRAVLLTGASSGIGRELAIQLGQQGASVGLMARRIEALESLADEIRGAGGDALVLPADVSNRSDVESGVARFEQAWGPVQTLIANAGYGTSTPAKRLPVDEVERIMRINFFGVVYAAGAALPGMLEAGDGHIVGVSSLAAYRGLPLASAYAASKAALSSWLEGLRIELRRKGIGVTSVHPGYVRTPMTAPNKGPMPFIIDADKAAGIILNKLGRRPAEINFPFQMATAMGLLRMMPNFAYDRIMGKN